MWSAGWRLRPGPPGQVPKHAGSGRRRAVNEVMMIKVDEQLALLRRGADEIIQEDELRERIASGRP